MNKTNPDYSASAVNLQLKRSQTLEQAGRLARLSCLNAEAASCKQALEATAEFKRLQDVYGDITLLKAEIREFIDADGSYQDVERGLYAVKQERLSPVYSPELVRQKLPRYASALIEETVNPKALDGLLRGKLITAEQVSSVVGETHRSYAYIIQAEEPPSNLSPPIERKADDIKTRGDLFTACLRDFKMTRSDVLKLLGISTQAELSASPSECYAAVKSRVQVAPSLAARGVG